MTFTFRFICAVIDKLSKKCLFWPDVEEKAIIKHRIEDKFGFPSCIGFIDGTLLKLYAAPKWSRSCFYSRKSFYAVSAQVVCDDHKRIRDFFTGYAGSAHDMRVYNGSQLCKKSSRYFPGDEYLLADSAYSPSLSVMPLYRESAPSSLSQEDTKFNCRHKKARVYVEHCIGILKGRFQSLIELRLPVRDKNDVARVKMWAKACIILHNLMINTDDKIDEELMYEEVERNVEENSGESATNEIDENRPLNEARNGKEKRAIVQRILREKGMLE